MKKILTTLIVFTASFMLLLMVSDNKVYALDHQETFTLNKDPDFDYNIDLYGFLEYSFANLPDGAHPTLTVEIDVLTYTDASITKSGDTYSLTFDTYVIEIDNTTITSTGTTIADGVYTLDFYLPYPTYEDLFYKEYIIEIEILEDYKVTSGTFEKLDEINLSSIINEATIIYNGNEFTNNDVFRYMDPLSYGVSLDWGSYEFNIYEDNTYSDVQENINIGDIIKVKILRLMTWTQSHSYGRIRSNESTMYLNQPSSTAVFLSHSEATNVLNVSNIAVGDEIVLQSPYKNFEVSYGVIGFPRQVLVTQADVAAVKITKNNVDNTNYTFDIWYWTTGGGLEYRRQENVNLANRNSLNIKFDGGFRVALGGQTAIIGNVDDNNDIQYYLDFLTAWDDIDGDISDSIYVVDAGNYDGSVVGTYQIIAGVKDSEDQESTFAFTAIVADTVAPQLVAPNLEQEIATHQTFNFTTYLAQLVVTDNYYADADITITILSNQYTPNKSVPGTYDVVLRVKDPSLNQRDYTLQITVVDTTPPEFTQGLTTLSKSVNENITSGQLVATQKAVDAVDGDVSASIEVVSNSYQGNENVPGTYTIIIKASDAAGNERFKTITINVFSMPPGWYVPDNGPIIIPAGSTLTFEQIRAVLINLGWITVEDEVELMSSGYFGNETTPGTYNLSVSVNGTPQTFNLLVLNQNEDWLPNVPDLPVQTSIPVFGIVAASIAALALIGFGIYFINKRKVK